MELQVRKAIAILELNATMLLLKSQSCTEPCCMQWGGEHELETQAREKASGGGGRGVYPSHSSHAKSPPPPQSVYPFPPSMFFLGAGTHSNADTLITH